MYRSYFIFDQKHQAPLFSFFQAMELLQRALKITPENAACRFYRARLLYERHEYEKCKDELNELKLYAHDEAQVSYSYTPSDLS